MTAEITKTGHRQLEPMAKRVNIEPIKEEVVKKILAGEDDPRLTWRGKAVHVVLSRVFPKESGAKRTIDGRRKRLPEAIREGIDASRMVLRRPKRVSEAGCSRRIVVNINIGPEVIWAIIVITPLVGCDGFRRRMAVNYETMP